jgi:RNA polymerase sigma-32 factor
MSRTALPVLSTEAGLAQYLQEISQFPMLEEEEELKLAKNWSEQGNIEAAHKLVTSHRSW